MKILIIGGMHGNEPLGPAVIKQLVERPLKNVDSVLANEQALELNQRFVKQDLNRSFPGVAGASDYETRRANDLIKLCKGYDLVLDFHNTHCPDNDCGFIGDRADSNLERAASFLGLKRLIVADYDCLNKYAPNCLSVEISLSSPRCRPEVWFDLIAELAQIEKFPASPPLQKFKFVYRVTLEDRDRLDLPGVGLRAFKPLPPALAKNLGVKSPAYPIFIADEYTPYNYGGLLNKLT